MGIDDNYSNAAEWTATYPVPMALQVLLHGVVDEVGVPGDILLV